MLIQKFLHLCEVQNVKEEEVVQIVNGVRQNIEEN
jgi:hypothetical protein